MSTATILFSKGLVDEGIEFERIEKELNDIKNKLKNNCNTCPHCMAVLKPFKYIGYYDEHTGWYCDCDTIENAEEWRGGYA